MYLIRTVNYWNLKAFVTESSISCHHLISISYVLLRECVGNNRPYRSFTIIGKFYNSTRKRLLCQLSFCIRIRNLYYSLFRISQTTSTAMFQTIHECNVSICMAVCLENFLKYCGAEYNILSICRKNLFKKQVNVREHPINYSGIELIELA